MNKKFDEDIRRVNLCSDIDFDLEDPEKCWDMFYEFLFRWIFINRDHVLELLKDDSIV